MTCQKMIIIPPKNVSWIEFGLFGKKKRKLFIVTQMQPYFVNFNINPYN